MMYEDWKNAFKSAEEIMEEFPLGSYVTYKNVPPPYSIKTEFERYENRGYMIVTDYGRDGWLKFDNVEFTRAGGSWNPSRFKVIPKPSSLPEDLFEI